MIVVLIFLYLWLEERKSTHSLLRSCRNISMLCLIQQVVAPRRALGIN